MASGGLLPKYGENFGGGRATTNAKRGRDADEIGPESHHKDANTRKLRAFARPRGGFFCALQGHDRKARGRAAHPGKRPNGVFCALQGHDRKARGRAAHPGTVNVPSLFCALQGHDRKARGRAAHPGSEEPEAIFVPQRGTIASLVIERVSPLARRPPSAPRGASRASPSRAIVPRWGTKIASGSSDPGCAARPRALRSCPFRAQNTRLAVPQGCSARPRALRPPVNFSKKSVPFRRVAVTTFGDGSFLGHVGQEKRRTNARNHLFWYFR